MTSFIKGRTIRYNTFINQNPWTFYIAITLTLEQLTTLFSHVNLQKKRFSLQKPFMRQSSTLIVISFIRSLFRALPFLLQHFLYL